MPRPETGDVDPSATTVVVVRPAGQLGYPARVGTARATSAAAPALDATSFVQPRVADRVFEHLARAILEKQLEAGKPLPSERELAERFAVSRVVLREAIHRLKELSLVRVRPGGATLVLDPDEADDPRVSELAMQLGLTSGDVEREVVERMLLHAAALLELAEPRLVRRDLAALGAEVDAYQRAGEGGLGSFLERYWVRVADASKNRIYRRETRWWYSVLGRRYDLRATLSFGSHETRVVFYRAINERLERRAGAARFYLDSVRHLLGTTRPRARTRSAR
jgi:DNA-binding FadR family transcriptional regulator